MENVRIAIRDSTDSHNVAFFDNISGIRYQSANLQRFLAGSASILTIEYNSKDIDTVRTGCKLAFIYKERAYWLNIMDLSKKGYKVEITAYSLGLELNQEERGAHKPANAMRFAEYLAYYDPEHALELGVNEVADKRIKLEWTGTDTILARLFSIANSFDAELEFTVELNQDYSLKRQVLNVYKKGNLGSNRAASPIRVGRGLKVINYSDNLKELRTAVRATGKDGLTIDGLNKKVYDDDGNLLYYSNANTVYAPQSRDKYPSVGKKSNDNWIIKELGETEYSTKEALWGYMLGELKKICVPEITYDIEGAVDGDVGDTRTLIDDVHYDPPLYVQARISELTEDLITGRVTKSTLTNFERKYSQIADSLLKQVEALAEDAAPYIVRLSTDNGYNFKNGQGTSTITARLEKYSKDIAATWKWVVDNKVVGTGDKLTVKAEQVTNTMAVTVIAYVNGNEVVRDYMTFSNSDDGVGVESIDRYFTSSDQSDGVTIEGAEWSDKPPAPTEDGKYLWAYDEITYTDGTVTTTKPAAVGANFDVDAFRAEIAEDLKDVPNREEFENKIAEELANSKAEIETQIETAKTQAESNAKEYADTINQETAKVAEQANTAADEIKADLVNVKNNLTATSLVANNAQAAVDEAKQDLTEVASELNTAKQDLANSVTAVNTKVDSTKAELTQAKQDLTSHAQQLQTQANAQTELSKRVTTVETTANGTKTTVNELTKTVAQNGKDITSVTNRTKTVEDDLANTKTTLTQVQTTANSASQKTATLETGLNGVKADLTATTTTANTTKQNLASYQASNDKAVANLQSNIQTANGNISSLQTKVEAVPGQITSAVSAVEGKIPTNVSTRNLILKSNDLANPHKQNGANTTVTSTDDYFVIKSTGYTANAWGGISWNMSISEMKAGEQFSILMPVYIDSSISLDNGWSFNIKNHSSNSSAYDYSIPTNKKDQWFNVAITFKAYNNVVFDTYPFYVYLVKNGLVRIKPPMLVRGNLIPSDYQPAFEDTKSDVTKLNTTLTQTANGLEQLSTQVTSQGSTITSHTNSINSLSTGLSAKVSQTDFNTLSGRVTTAENNITAKANELSSKISSLNVGGKNYLPTSRVINRGCSNFSYSNTSKSWTMTVPASSTTFGNGITFNTNSLNILLNGGETLFFGLMIKANKACSFNYDINNALSGIASNDNDDRSKQAWSPSNKSIPANVWTRVWFSYTAKANVPITEANSNFGIVNNTEAITVEIKEVMVAKSNVPVDYQTPDADFEAKDSELKQTTDSIKASVSSLDKSTVKSASLTINTDGIVMKAGKSTTDVANAIGSYFAVNQNAINLFSDKINVKGSMIVEGAITSNKIASKSINTAHLNGKIITADVIATGAITANAIKAGAVTTDKMTANSINGDRITAGTLDAAKIKAGSITASQIASGTITSAQIKTGTISAANIAAGAITTDKIAANSINSSKIVSSGITANVIKGGKLQSLSNATNFELDTGKLFYNNNNTGIFRVQANASTMGLKFSNTSITVSGTSRILSRVILGGDRRETSLDDGKWDQGGFTGIVAETINGVDSNAHSQADTLRVIGDNIYFTHSYNYDAQTKTSAQGWKMETFSPFSSYAGNVVLKPYGINYRQSDIITGDVRLDNGDGSGYWVRGCIRTLRNCFQHYLNGGTTSGAMNAIRDALKEISGV